MASAPLYGGGAPSNDIMRTSYAGNDATPGSNQFTGNFTPRMPAMFTPGNTATPGGGGYSSPYPMFGNPYQVPESGGWNNPTSGPFGGPLASKQGVAEPGATHNLGHGIMTTGLQFPGLASNFADYINSQIGQGLTPFNLSTQLPTGGMTQPGQLTAGLNPLLQQLQNFFMTGQGGGMPGMQNLSTIANQGVSALPEWQAMVAAMNQNTQQNEANLKEQFASMGDLAGSPFGTAMSNYLQQTNLDQNSLLGQLTQSNIQNIQMPAIESLFGGSQQMAGGLQALDQQAIQNMYQEFQRIQPQNNPLMQYMMGLGTLYPPTTKTPTTWDMVNSTLSALSGAGMSKSSGPGGDSTQISF